MWRLFLCQEQFRRDNEKGIEYEGKHYTQYEATQRQRGLERAIRKKKRQILIDEKLGDTDQLPIDQTRYVVLKDEYNRFSKAAGLRTQQERMNVPGFGPKQDRAAIKSARRRDDIADSPKPVQQETKQNVPKLFQNTSNATAKSSPVTGFSTPAPQPLNPTANTQSPRQFSDITGNWYPDAKPGSHIVQDLQSVTVNGVTYQVDGRNVVLDYKPHEKEIAELLEREVGGELYMVPRVNNPQGISTPDYLFHGKGYDLKTIGETTGKNPVFNRIKNAKAQADSFILDLTSATLSEEFLQAQIEKVFSDRQTHFADEVVLIRNGRIDRVLKRVKEES